MEGTSLAHDDHHALCLELAESNPGPTNASTFERHWNRQLLRLALCGGPVTQGLQVGCGTRAFTEQLAPHCERLTVLDVEPKAPCLTRLRIQDFSHIDWVVCEDEPSAVRELFDLIVGTDVLCHPPGIAELRTALENVVRVLAPGGHLVFGSRRGSIHRRWGHFASAGPEIASLNLKRSQLPCVRSPGEWLLRRLFGRTLQKRRSTSRGFGKRKTGLSKWPQSDLSAA
ncbi:SAM-dependent methyltransferase [Mesorhizobium atlanticum]